MLLHENYKGFPNDNEGLQNNSGFREFFCAKVTLLNFSILIRKFEIVHFWRFRRSFKSRAINFEEFMTRKEKIEVLKFQVETVVCQDLSLSPVLAISSAAFVSHYGF